MPEPTRLLSVDPGNMAGLALWGRGDDGLWRLETYGLALNLGPREVDRWLVEHEFGAEWSVFQAEGQFYKARRRPGDRDTFGWKTVVGIVRNRLVWEVLADRRRAVVETPVMARDWQRLTTQGLPGTNPKVRSLMLARHQFPRSVFSEGKVGASGDEPDAIAIGIWWLQTHGQRWTAEGAPRRGARWKKGERWAA